MSNKRLSKKWLYTFIAIAIAALVTCLFSLHYKEEVIAIGTGLVFVAQILNIIRWKRG